MTKYEKFKEEYDKKKYTSTTAEFKRVITRKVTQNILAPIDEVFKFFLDTITKGTDKKGQRDFYQGEKFSVAKRDIFMEHFTKNSIIEYRFKQAHSRGGVEFQIFKFTFKPVSKGQHTKVSYSHGVKLPTTITGFNGKLGTLKYRKTVKKEADRAFKHAKETLEKQANKK